MKTSAILMAGATAFILGACGKSEPNTITVSEKVELELPSDSVKLDIYVGTRGDTSADVLKKIGVKLEQVQSDLKQMRDINTITIETSEATVRPSPSQDCLLKTLELVDKVYDVEELLALCPDSIFEATVELRVTASPPEVAGNMMSYAIELGSAEVELREFFIANEHGAMLRAKETAAAKVKGTAEKIASASGVEINGLVKMTFNGDRQFSNSDFFDGDEVIVTGSRFKHPSYTIKLEPSMKKVSTTVVATYSVSEE